jgi:WD40 repeat protein
MAVHPSGKQLICGDKQGFLRVYDLATMREIQGIQAHSAEVLSLHYSPPLRPVGDGLWTVDLADSGDEQQELVLLASAGRDRLVHVFNASKGYSPVRTLDNHSSSVTVVKFTPDGSKLLSCGGDRTMVFNSVCGADISRVKSVQTPHGTINGLAIEATNKFAVTSGQVLI